MRLPWELLLKQREGAELTVPLFSMKRARDEAAFDKKKVSPDTGEYHPQLGSPHFQISMPNIPPRANSMPQMLLRTNSSNMLTGSFYPQPSMVYSHENAFRQNGQLGNFRPELRRFQTFPHETAAYPIWPRQFGSNDPGQLGVAFPQTNQEAPASPNSHGTSATKTSVYKAMHDCYLSNCRNTGRQDAFHSTGYNIPTYEDLEQALPTEAMVNAARIAMLRSRHLMRQTLGPLKHKLPCEPERYVINSITTCCPICGRAIALNKLASHENWCKHLECCHRDVGKAISARFRALAKNAEDVPSLETDFDKWAEIKTRVDMAPTSESGVYTSRHLVPLASDQHWISVLFHQLLAEGALLPYSIITQEIVVFGLNHYNMRTSERVQFEDLRNFQTALARYPQSFRAYCEEHVGVVELTGNEPPTEDFAAAEEAIRDLYNSYTLKGARPSFKEIENAIRTTAVNDGEKAVNALRLVVLRRRQLLSQCFKSAGYRSHASQLSKFVVNAAVTCCPLCNEEVVSSLNDLGDNALCLHLTTAHGKAGPAIANIYSTLDRNEHISAIPLVGLPPLATCNADLRPDFAADDTVEVASESVSTLVSLKETSIDWRSVMLDHLLQTVVLRSTSVMTQELVIMGLFYFGLVNQRSPQKLGQYLQLQAFQVGLHERSGPGYEIYIGAGIKEGDLSASYTRGRPVQATREVIQSYHHYGLSRKSIQRNDRKRKRSKSACKVTESAKIE